MNRLYVIEPVHSITGASADRRLAVRPGQIAAVAVRIAAALGVSEVKPDGATIDRSQAAFLDPLIADLKKAEAGRTVVVAGPRQPPEVHALVAAINHRLGNNGKTVVYYADPGPERPSHFAGLRTLVGTMKSGEVKTLFILGGNPVYDAPADLKFAEALDKVPNRIHLALHEDETSQLCTWHLSRAHYLEAWGDVRTYDGTVSITQPLIQPLFDGRSTIEVLAMLTGDKEGIEGGQKIVRRTMKSLVGDGFDEWKWKKSLAEGVVDGTAWKPVELASPRTIVPPPPETDAVRTAEKTLDLVFLAEGKTYDGRFANNGWLREFPEPMTRLTWDNAALISPATAEAQHLRRDQLIVLQMPGSERQLHVPVFILPGMADGVIALALGYGRKSAGNVGNEVGQNAYLARTSNGLGWRPDVTIAPSERTYRLATVQDHHTIDAVGKKATQERIPQLVVEGTLDEYAEEPSLGVEKTSLPSIFNEHKFDGRVDGAKENELVEKHQLHKWGMAIDLTACTGCGACVVACQAEVLLGREMHWIRVDRYFRDAEKGPESVHQPLPCMHCENAPCESVCPVAATTHSQEGINMMTYNRCVGVRYCLNNCPYKVRRFNYFDFNRGTLKDQYEPNLLRHPDSELAMMQKNPEVTVRSRGVMEKCTYCVQRIEHARIAARREGNRPIRDGEIQTACQQSCPAGAIVFGDLNDPKSRVSKLFAQARAYGLLDGYLNTKPRTVYLARVRNT
jgi:molybdopterin-containing oxidoreductase family iron-sulfur binding subunit